MSIASATRALLPPMVAACARNRIKATLLGLVVAVLCVFASANFLGVTTDTGGMFAASLDWKRRSDTLAKLFPQNDDLIVAVVNAAIPEEAEATAEALEQALTADRAHFKSIRRPDALPFLQRNAFLLVDAATLEDTLNRTVDAQPFLGQLTHDPSLRGLFAALGLVAQGIEHKQSVSGIAPALQKFHVSLASAAAGKAQPLSWQELLGGKLAEQAGRYRFVLFKPVLDYTALEPGGAAIDEIRAAAAKLPYVKQGLAQVRLTGSVVLDGEEFATVAEGAVAGLIASFLLVMVWLYLAVRSWRLMLPIMATLVLGLLLTTGFAAVAIGTLNLISVAFAVLFVGIAVDFAIQFSVRLRERLHTVTGVVDALRETGRRAGSQILVASLATAAGFLAFTPTNFVGVAQLGVIAGVGMLIAFVCTLTFLPAMLALCRPHPEPREVGFAFAKRLDPWVARRRVPIAAAFGVLALAGAVLAAKIPFDGDPLHTKDPHSEAIRTLHDLMQDPVTNPYTIEALFPSLKEADAAGAKLAKLPLSQDVVTLSGFLPDDQDQKLALIADAAGVLASTLAPPEAVAPVTPESLRQATRALAAQLDALRPKLAPDDAMRLIADDVGRLKDAPDAALLAANDALTRFLPTQLARLRLALAATKISLKDIPEELKRDYLLPDGRARLQVFPKAAVVDGHQLRRWVKQALRTVPESAGSAVWILKSADTITTAFQIAAYSALVVIAIILALALRRTLDVVLVMTPLLISALLTALVLRLSGMSLNFANIIALPLLLGVGVSFNIYFVMNWRAGMHRFLGSATARAVLFSALTTSTAFGSLALSKHPGTASMGVLLLISLGMTVVTTLVFVPAMLALAPRPHVPLGGQ